MFTYMWKVLDQAGVCLETCKIMAQNMLIIRLFLPFIHIYLVTYPVLGG